MTDSAAGAACRRRHPRGGDCCIAALDQQPPLDDAFLGTERFELRRRIGAGGFGFVYEAWDRDRKERVALKTLRDPTAETIRVLKNEFRVVRDIDHPNLVRLGELFEHEGAWFFTMEFVEGTTVTHFVRPTDPETGGSGISEQATRPPSGAFDEARLRSVLSQLVRALATLHAAGKVHRDIKPANLLVEPTGRLVVLDFGIVTEVGRDLGAADAGITGTPHFMAPEQAASESVGPPSDLYAVGVILFRCLTGTLPFRGEAQAVLENKLIHEAPRPSALVPGLPPDLESICVDLLRTAPEERPTAPAIIARLEGEAARMELDLAIASATFVGREAERKVLFSSVRPVANGYPVTAIIDGESGVGKSSLAKEFMRATAETDLGMTWFVGRCYERESVPFKAVDGIIDQISEYCARLPDVEREALVPEHADLLIGTFPVLERLRRESGAASVAPVVTNPRERRARVFEAFRQLLRNIASRALVGIIIEDLQWADADSVALLSEVFEPSHAPPVLFLGTTRLGSAELAEKFGAAFSERTAISRIRLGRLSEDEARELAVALIGPSGAPRLQEAVRTIVKESDGHPMFIGDLVEQHLRAGFDGGPIRLEDALQARIKSQSAAAKRLLQVIAVAELPVPDDVARAAADIPPSEFHAIVARLRRVHLVQTSGSGRMHSLELFHERVRHAVAGALTAEERAELHRRLADALEARGDADDEVLARHLRGAGEDESASLLLTRAAESAVRSLAFERAARLFAEVAARTKDRDGARTLRRRQADALRDAGRLAECAEVLASLAEDAGTLEALDLRRSAAEYFVSSGQFDKGTAFLRTALAAVRERFPESPLAVIFWLLLARARLAFRGLSFVARPPVAELSRKKARLDTLWSAGMCFSMTDNARGAYFLSRNLLKALQAGDQPAITHAVFMELCFVSSEGKKKAPTGARLFSMLEALAKVDERPYTRATLPFASGWLKYMVGVWPEARAGFLEGERILRDDVIGFRYQLASGRTLLYRTLAYMGRFQEMRERVPPVLREAEKQNDQFMLANVRANPLVWIGFADDSEQSVEAAVREAERALTPSRFLLQHFYVLLAKCNLDLYRGEAMRAYERLSRTWPAVRRSLLLRIQVNRILAYDLRARVAVAAAGATSNPALVREAVAHAKQLSKEGLVCADAPAESTLGQIALLSGDRGEARTRLERAIALFDSLEMRLYSSAAKQALGALVGGEEGAKLTLEASTWAKEERIVSSERLFALVVPGGRPAP